MENEQFKLEIEQLKKEKTDLQADFETLNKENEASKEYVYKACNENQALTNSNRHLQQFNMELQKDKEVLNTQNEKLMQNQGHTTKLQVFTKYKELANSANAKLRDIQNENKDLLVSQRLFEDLKNFLTKFIMKLYQIHNIP